MITVEILNKQYLKLLQNKTMIGIKLISNNVEQNFKSALISIKNKLIIKSRILKN